MRSRRPARASPPEERALLSSAHGFSRLEADRVVQFSVLASAAPTALSAFGAKRERGSPDSLSKLLYDSQHTCTHDLWRGHRLSTHLPETSTAGQNCGLLQTFPAI